MRVSILGQGLAGTVLAWQCLRAGLAMQIIDADEPVTASKIAAGLVTPIVGRRFALTEDIDALLVEMRSLYAWVEEQLAVPLFVDCPHVRIMASAAEAALVAERRADPRLAPFWEEEPARLEAKLIAPPWGGVTLRQGGFLRVADFLFRSRAYFAARGWFRIGRAEEIDFRAAKEPLVYCLGPWAVDLPPFDWQPIRFTHGDVLRLCIPDLREPRVLNRECWLLPMEEDGHYLAGSTYLRGQGPVARPSKAGRLLLERRLRRMLRCPFEVLEHRAAIRPASPQRRVVVEQHPSFSAAYFFNGLGSKGVLTAPFHARALVAQWLA